jgi:hypothetical protein
MGKHDIFVGRKCGKNGNDSSSKVDRIVRVLQAHPLAAVRRPVGGEYIEGEAILP